MSVAHRLCIAHKFGTLDVTNVSHSGAVEASQVSNDHYSGRWELKGGSKEDCKVVGNTKISQYLLFTTDFRCIHLAQYQDDFPST
jgi:hypothetical protein